MSEHKDQTNQDFRIAFFTICSRNYIPYARVLFSSLALHHPECDHYLCLADRTEGCFDPRDERYEVIEAESLPIPNFPAFAFRYDIQEFNTAVKPYAFVSLFERDDYDAIVYLDPDIKVFSRLHEVIDRLKAGAPAVLTPHLTHPIEEEEEPNDLTMLRVGVYNLGFIALARHRLVDAFLGWWCRRLEHQCLFNRLKENLFVDQKFVDLLPCFIEGASVVHDPGYNVAYWNLLHRKVKRQRGQWFVNDRPLAFFHFSGVVPGNKKVLSKHQRRFNASNIGDARWLLEQYLEELDRNGMEEAKRWRYAYGQFSNGEPIVPFMRYIFREELEPLSGDPFTENGEVFNKPDPRVEQDDHLLITWLMYRVWREREDLQQVFDLKTAAGREGFVRWYLATARKELAISAAFVEPIRARFLAGEGASDAVSHSAVSEGVRVLIGAGPRIASRLLASAPAFRPIYRHLQVAVRHRVKTALLTYAYHRAVGGAAPAPASTDTPAAVSGRAAGCSVKPGVMLTGYARAEMGVGQGVRMQAQALQAANVHFAVFNVSTSHLHRQKDHSLDRYLQTENRFNTNLIHVNADEVPNLVGRLPLGFMADRYNIAFWAWELARFPDAWLSSFDCFDEVWVPSTFVQQSVAMVARKPVVVMPHAILRRPETSFGPAHFGLPNGKLLYLFAFDYNSYVARKNPTAVVEAFQRAFPRDRDDVALVMKAQSGQHYPEHHAQLLALICDDPRIFCVDWVLSPREVAGLQTLCDAFVSLHRSEGFGLGLAEAMFLGKPVIATNYSGNTDFTLAGNSCLVDYRLIPVESGQYPYGEGQVWADPDLDQASWYMRRLFDDVGYRDRIGLAAQRYMKEHHHPKVIGARYVRRLKFLHRI